MPQLSSPLWALEASYDVVIIGSGYGGAIAANRLARARRPDGSAPRVALLERGQEIPTGEFPDTAEEAAAHFTLDHTLLRTGAENGLYYFHHNDEITVLQGCALGGTSHINANVSLEPDRRVFDDPRWPQALRQDIEAGLRAGYAQARAMLRPERYPDRAPHGSLRKYEELKRAAGADALVYHPPLNINYDGGVNHVGIAQPPCNGCGDCVSGCNVGAKNVLTKNYLPDAKNRGVHMFCGVNVRSVRRGDGEWIVYFVPVGQQRELYSAPELFVRAGAVILSAGSLGSSEILLRSKERGLPLSACLGSRFTGNGDVLGFSYNGDTRINGIGRGQQVVDAEDAPGPTITGAVDLRGTALLDDGFIIEEGALPSAMRALLPFAFKAAAAITSPLPGEGGVAQLLRQKAREWLSVVTAHVGGAYRGATAHTQTFLTMCHDDGEGKIVLRDDRPRILWPKLGRQRIFQLVAARLQKIAAASGGRYVPSPLFTKYFNFDLLTVHPLGGAALADDASTGVVDARHLVFSGEAGQATHPDLYVMDGSVIPRPLGVNPLLTIAALSERSVRLMIAAKGWSIDDSFPRTDKAHFDGVRDLPRPTTLQFSERMRGYITASPGEDFVAAAKLGESRGHEATAVYCISSPDLDAMIADPDRAARLTGTVFLAELSREAMTIVAGQFNLFVDVAGPAHKRMRYRMTLSSVEGKTFYVDGYKEVYDERGFDAYADTTTLFTTVHEGDEHGPVVARGILKISAKDTLGLLRTMRAFDGNGKPSLLDRARFAQLFFGDVWDVYGRKYPKERAMHE